ncbi:hypothetical protein D3C87_225640 [compost metagenome]
MKKIIWIYLFLVNIIFSCKTKTENIDFEKNVLIGIIPSIVDSTCQDPRIFLSPPTFITFPPPAGMNSITKATQRKQHKQLLKQWQFKLDSIKKDTSSIYLAFNPLIKISTDSLEKKLASYTNRKILKTNSKKNLTLDINSIKLNKHFKFKNDSSFSKNINVWNEKYDFVFSGFFNVSRIVFDESKSHGILSAGYSCGERCGQGYIIYIKQEDNKWKIDKIEETWIS